MSRRHQSNPSFCGVVARAMSNPRALPAAADDIRLGWELPTQAELPPDTVVGARVVAYPCSFMYLGRCVVLLQYPGFEQELFQSRRSPCFQLFDHLLRHACAMQIHSCWPV